MRLTLRRSALAVLAALFLAGCDGQDADRLARVGRKTNEKFHALTGGSQEKLSTGWLAVRANWDDVTLDTRVAARLRWDKALVNNKIEVTASDGVVELKGKVGDLIQRRRAVEIAQSTAGVNEVRDSLEVAGP
jgi:hypothetical protein